MSDKEMEEKLADLMDTLTALLSAITDFVKAKTKGSRLRGTGS